MNNKESEQVNIEQKPQISIELDGSVIQLPLSTFNDILEREITNYILKKEANENNIIDLNDLVNVQSWKTKYKELENQANILRSIIHRFKRNLETDKFAQPPRCMSTSVSQNVNISTNVKMANAHGHSNTEQQIFTISDSEDDPIVITTDTSKNKAIQTQDEIIIDLDNETQDLKAKYKPGPKSKTIVSKQDFKTNDNNKELPMNTEASKTLSNGERLSTTIRKRKPGPKSKTMVVDDIVPNKAVNKEPVEKKMCLNECKDIKNKKSNTTNLLNCNSVKKLEVPKKHNHNLLIKSSSLKYPPPYPLIPPHNNQPSWKNVPPIPNMTIKTSGNKVTLTWNLNVTYQTAEIKLYELFVCQETDKPPEASMWKKKGCIEADILPMACELEVFDLGYVYYFALRAVDVHNRRAPFALLKTKV